MTGSVNNPSPLLVDNSEANNPPSLDDADLDALRDELFSIVRHIRDPEHALTLEQLGVVTKARIRFPPSDCDDDSGRSSEKSNVSDNDSSTVIIEIVPTVPHCSLASLIGLCIRARVSQDWPQLKLTVVIREDAHLQARDISKQLNDKERCCAAIENPALKSTIDKLISHQSSID